MHSFMIFEVNADRVAKHVNTLHNIAVSMSKDVLLLEDDISHISMLHRYHKAVVKTPLWMLYGDYTEDTTFSFFFFLEMNKCMLSYIDIYHRGLLAYHCDVAGDAQHHQFLVCTSGDFQIFFMVHLFFP